LGIPLPVMTATPEPQEVIASAPRVNNLVAHLQKDEAL
jgi:hypothetical protein